jgi:hypothetical protein
MPAPLLPPVSSLRLRRTNISIVSRKVLYRNDGGVRYTKIGPRRQ